jgi:uncharacterized protein with PIN domain
MNLFIDTSALVKLYHDELGTESLTKFLYSHSENLIITISDLSKIEFHAAFLKCVRTGEIELLVAENIFVNFDEDSKWLNIIEFTIK